MASLYPPTTAKNKKELQSEMEWDDHLVIEGQRYAENKALELEVA